MQAPDVEESLDVDAIWDADVGDAASEHSEEPEFRIATAASERGRDLLIETPGHAYNVQKRYSNSSSHNVLQ